ncbi:MAG: FAS1-like dehydratase domain-containing protein [Gammaproteobacteria bacterium]
MPLVTACIGLETEPFRHEVDARWTMAYSAALGDLEPVFLDTSRAGGVVAHPLFAICPEWPVALASRDQLKQRGLTQAEFNRAVHATHDCHVHRLIRPGDTLTTSARLLTMEARSPGGYVTTCFDTRDAAGELVCRTFHGQIMRETEIMSVDKAPTPPLDPGIEAPPFPAVAAGPQPHSVHSIDIHGGFAHTYTECARIFNPIHTDTAVARAAGLPDFILHGSATLALAVSLLFKHHAGGDPSRVRRITAAFRGMVLLPSTLELRCFEPAAANGLTVVPFEVLGADGRAVINRASVSLD